MFGGKNKMIFVMDYGSEYDSEYMSYLRKNKCNVIFLTLPSDNDFENLFTKERYIINDDYQSNSHGTAITYPDLKKIILFKNIIERFSNESIQEIIILDSNVSYDMGNLLSLISDFYNGGYECMFVDGIILMKGDIIKRVSNLINIPSQIILQIREYADMCKKTDLKVFLMNDSIFGRKYVIGKFFNNILLPPIITPKKNFYHSNNFNKNIQVVTVASDPTDGYKRFVESCNVYNFPYVVLGMDQPWEWDMTVAPGGGKKVNLFKKYLSNFNNDDESLIIFSDSYDVVLNSNPDEILDKYQKMNSDIIFSAEPLIWPNRSLSSRFKKPLNQSPYIYLNSGGFIGKISDLKRITLSELSDSDDDQLYYQLVYLNSIENPSDIKIILDHNCYIFQTLSTLFEDITVDESKSRIKNRLFPSHNPSIIHGNGGVNSKLFLNSLCNYVPMKYITDIGYIDVLSGSNIEQIIKTPLKILFLVCVCDGFERNYDNLFKQNLISKSEHKFVFYGSRSLEECRIIIPSGSIYHMIESSVSIRDLVLKEFSDNQFDYYFMGSTNHFITDENLIEKLILTKKDIVAPMIKSKTSLFSNFWGEVAHDGFYKRSCDYVSIVQSEKKGIWNVPYVNGSILISKLRMKNVLTELKANQIGREDFDMYFCRVLRKKYIFLHVTNKEEYGYMN